MGLRELIGEVSDPTRVIERVLGQALVLIPAASGASVQLGAEPGYVSCVAAVGRLAGAVGTRIPIEGSMHGRCLLEGSLEHCSNTADDPRIDALLSKALSITSMLCVPLRRHTGVRIGVLLISSDRPYTFGPDDEAILDRLTDFISTVIGASLDLASVTEQLLMQSEARPRIMHGEASGHEDEDRVAARNRATAFIANVMRPGAAVRAATRERIQRILAGDGLEMVFQAIVALDSGQVVDAEALARFEGPPWQAPDRWFQDAVAVGLGEQLELAAAAHAITCLRALPPSIGLAVNVGPRALRSKELLALIEASTPHRITLELTEHVDIHVSSEIRRVRQTLREMGVKLAIDDTGSGFASLSLVLEMGPDIIKLDRRLTDGVDLDPVRRALARSLVSFAAETGARVVAEGIETEAQLRVLTELGVPFGQGHHLGWPGSPEDLQLLSEARARTALHHRAR